MDAGHSERAVLVTGASTGIGRACSLRLAAKGIPVLAGVRNESDAAALTQLASENLTPLMLDVSSPDSIAAARESVAHVLSGKKLFGLVNNAGVFYGGPLEFASTDEMRRTFEVNVLGAVAVTQTFLPMLRTAQGRVVNMSSISGLIALPFLGPYAASKFALEAVSDSWRVELKPWGISVSLVEPGVVKTPFWDKVLATLRNTREGYPPEAHQLYGPVFGLSESRQRGGVSAERIAALVDHALFARRPKARYLAGSDARFLTVFRKLPTRLRDRLMAKQLPAYGRAESSDS